jgi:hypothetical protein
MASALYSAGAAHPRWSAAVHPGLFAGSRPGSLEAAAPAPPAAVSALGGGGAPQALLAVSGPACAAAAVAAAAPALATRTRLKRPPDPDPAAASAAVAPPSGCAGAGPGAGPGAKLGAKPERTSSLAARRVSFEAAQAAQHRSASCCSSASTPGGRAWRRLSGGSGGARRFSSLEARPGPLPCAPRVCEGRGVWGRCPRSPRSPCARAGRLLVREGWVEPRRAASVGGSPELSARARTPPRAQGRPGSLEVAGRGALSAG